MCLTETALPPIIAWKAVWFLIYTLLCSGAVWLRYRDLLDDKDTFLTFLQTGYLRFWEYGFGFGVIGGIVAIVVSFICIWLNGYWGLKAKREAAGRDVEKRAAELAATMRAAMEAEVASENEESQTWLRQWENRLAVETRQLRTREEKVDSYKQELKAVRDTHKLYACNHQEIKVRAQRAIEVLEREEPSIGEAKRLVRKVIKLA